MLAKRFVLLKSKGGFGKKSHSIRKTKEDLLFFLYLFQLKKIGSTNFVHQRRRLAHT